MSKFLRAGLLLLLVFVLASGTAMAAPDKIDVIVNDVTVPTDVAPYIKQGTTIVPLNVVQKIPGISVTWENTTKTITIVRDGETITLVAGQKTATVGSEQVALTVASSLEKGHVMVPLRFIAASAGAEVVWNAKTRSVYVAKASDALTAQRASANLAEARTAAVQFPRVSLLKNFNITNDTQNQDYYFPEGKSDSFFIQGGNGIDYYKVSGNHSELVWRAKFDYRTKASNSLFFLPYKIVEQDGKAPSITGRLAFYHLMLPVMEATYGFIGTDGQMTTVGQNAMALDKFFEIQGEK
ncbi:copper amine oxidase N-terminal domain-containing protein [Paenibacillus graminis]|uniref:Copper amine oxidase-like N-terminal domain-containing protein n=1 Tax=Paenibacillus graminis TaxID=189425 RepID=A0A089MJC4_9BACL|nr:copper amine oxidase N-terminal domain-containing protein [Paenibacillus graminis]AIQ71638.1 hypothetical protein PGRAT_31670 [Paenibacillus graminis]